MKYHHAMPTPPTHNRGSKTIDDIFVTDNLTDVNNTGWLRFGEGIGNHQIAYMDIQVQDLIGKDRHEIACQSARKLQIDNEGSVKSYIKLCEHDFLRQKIAEKLYDFQRRLEDMTKKEIETMMNDIDDIRLQISLQSEKNAESYELERFRTPRRTYNNMGTRYNSGPY